jgi:signal transduction histidine kinase
MAKGEFLATMSHELRTPLNAIGGHADLLSMEIHGPINEAQREALQRVKRAQLHLLGLITDLLNFARLERGKLEYRIQSLVIQEVISDIAPMIEPQVASKGLTYDVRLPEEPIEVVADREKLVQIILNLVSNSVKFTPTSGHIVVDIAERSDGTQPPDLVFLRVSDTGIGIPMEKLETIFDPFVQLSQGLAARRDGTGLGLSISRALARGMGGDLRARSIAGTSTTFTVTLPRAAAT